MWANTPNTVLTSAVATAGTFTVSYPTGYNVDDFTLDAANHVLGVGASAGSKRYLRGADWFTLSFGASNITVTWRGASTLPVGTVASLQLDMTGANAWGGPGEEFVFPAASATLANTAAIARVRRVHTVSLDLGKPDALSAAYFRAAATVSGAGAVSNILQTQLDVPRNLTFLSAGNDSGITFTITGTDQYGQTVIETVTGANATTANGIKAFRTVSGIVASGASAGNVSIGYGNVLGLPCWVPSSQHIMREFLDGAAATAGTFVAGLARATKSTATTADVRGTYVPNSAPDGAKHYRIVCFLEDPTYLGNQQFDGVDGP